MTLCQDSREKAKAEGRTAVVGLFRRDIPGCILVVHSADFYTVCEEFLAARGLKIVDV